MPTTLGSKRTVWISVIVLIGSIMLSLAKGFFMNMPPPPVYSSQPVQAWLQGLQENTTTTASTAIDKIHLIVLVHGWMGNPGELSYLQSAIEKYSAKYRPPQQSNEHIYVYSVVGNDGTTSDGIAAGGSRVAHEVNALLADLVPHVKSELSLSFVGHSLGGMYARYALSELQLEHLLDDDSKRSIQVTPKIFCTTASPHLGVAGYTYVPIPRAAEYVIASAMQPTGRDLFRFTDVIDRMTTDVAFIKPLAQFAKRLAYACAHSADFQVPTATAAFLADTDTRHHRLEVARDEQFVAVAVETTKRTVEPIPQVLADEPLSGAQLADRLDALGWQKVLYDVREMLPSVVNPLVQPRPIEDASSQDSFTSAELLKDYASWKKERLHFPMGHNILVANAKNEAYAKMNAAGQPVMDQLAANLVNEITGTVPEKPSLVG